MIFQDDTANWDSEPIWVHWLYDEQQHVLMLCPLLSDIPVHIKRLWCKILKSVNAKEWLAFFEGQPTSLMAYKMIFSPQSIQSLIQQLSPQKIWALGFLEHEVLSMDVITSPPPSEWQKIGIKKHLWLNALNLLTK